MAYASTSPVLTSLILKNNGHLISRQTTIPTAAVDAGAGTGATVVLTNVTDVAGNLELDLGTIGTLSSGSQVTLTFNNAYGVAPLVFLTPTNGAAASNMGAFGTFVTSTTTTFSINFATAGVALSALKWNYFIFQTQ